MRFGWPSPSASPIEAVRKISRSLNVIGARSVRRMVSAKAISRVGIAFRQQDHGELVAGQPRQRILRLEQPAKPPCQRQQDRIADRDADGIVDLLEAVEIDHHHGGADRRVGLGEGQHAFETIDEELAVRQPGEIVMHCVVQQTLLGGLEFGHVGERADQAHHLTVGPDDRARLEREPQVMAVRRAQAEVLHQPATALLQNAVEGRAEAVAVERVKHIEPSRRRPFERATLEAKELLGLGASVDAIRGDVPVPDHVARAGQRQRAPLDIGDDVVGDAAGKCVLHDGKADQHHDQDQAAKQRRADDVVGDIAGDRHHQTDRPDHQQEPGRDQQHRTVVAVSGQIDDNAEAKKRNAHERQPRDSGGDRGIDQRDCHECGEASQPAKRDVHVAHMPAPKIEIGKQEHQQRTGKDRLARGAPDAFGARRHVEHLAPEAEVDADIDQHRPAERRSRREHHAALHHEQDGQEQRQQPGDADDDAVVEREAIDLVLVGIGLPQIELRQPVGAKLSDVGHHRAGIERDAIDVRGGTVLLLRPLARRW